MAVDTAGQARTPLDLKSAQLSVVAMVLKTVDVATVAAELAAFNQRFGLPTCATKAVAPSTALPLPAASKTTTRKPPTTAATPTKSAATQIGRAHV